MTYVGVFSPLLVVLQEAIEADLRLYRQFLSDPVYAALTFKRAWENVASVNKILAAPRS
jgi:hypothetical protein